MLAPAIVEYVVLNIPKHQNNLITLIKPWEVTGKCGMVPQYWLHDTYVLQCMYSGNTHDYISCVAYTRVPSVPDLQRSGGEGQESVIVNC